MRHFPKERGRPPRGTGEWDVMGLPFPPLPTFSAPVTPHIQRRPPKDADIIWYKKRGTPWQWRYRHTKEVKDVKHTQHQEEQRSYVRNQAHHAQYQRDWHSSIRNLPKIPTSGEEANSRDRYDDGPSLRRCECGTVFQGYAHSRCVWCSTKRAFRRIPYEEMAEAGNAGYVDCGWASTESLMGNFNVGNVGVDLIIDRYIPPPDLDEEWRDDDE